MFCWLEIFVGFTGQAFNFEDFTPPYLAPTTVGSVVLRGVNYASGGGGILNQTGSIFVSLKVIIIAYIYFYILESA